MLDDDDVSVITRELDMKDTQRDDLKRTTNARILANRINDQRITEL